MKGLDLEYDKNLHEKSGFMTFLRLLMLSEKELSHKGQILEKLNKVCFFFLFLLQKETY